MPDPTPRSRLVLYAPNGWGLGHLSRQVAIARGLRMVDPRVELLIATESSYGPQMAPEFPFIILPATRQIRTGAWRGTASGHHARTLLRLPEAILEGYRPGAVVHDTLVWPPLFDAAERMGVHQAMVVRMRQGMLEYLRDPASPVWRCDLLVFPYTATEVEPLLAEMPAGLPPLACVGQVARRPSTSADSTRKRIGLRDRRKLILVSAGAGGFADAETFYQLAVDALGRAAGELPPYFAMLVLGPAYNGALPLAESLNLYVWRDLTWLPDVINAADLVICQAGHNTIAELQVTGANAIVVPGTRQIDDQFARAREVSAISPSIRLLESPDPARMSALILRALAEGRAAPPVRDLPETPPPPHSAIRGEPELGKLIELGRVVEAAGELPDLESVAFHA